MDTLNHHFEKLLKYLLHKGRDLNSVLNLKHEEIEAIVRQKLTENEISELREMAIKKLEFIKRKETLKSGLMQVLYETSPNNIQIGQDPDSRERE